MNYEIACNFKYILLGFEAKSMLLLSIIMTTQIGCAINFIRFFQHKAAPELETQWLINAVK